MASRPHPYRGPFSWGARGLLAAAQIHAHRGERALARATTLRAFADDPASPLGTLFRAASLRKQGKRAEAIAVLEQALRQPHLRGANRMMLAQLYAEQHQPERARAMMAAAEREHSNDPQARALAVQMLSL